MQSSAYIAGEFRQHMSATGCFSHSNPADASDVLPTIYFEKSDVDDAVTEARRAFRSWRNASMTDRANYLKAFQAQLRARENDLVQAISREIGKPFWESKSEVAAMIGKIDLSIGEGSRFTRSEDIDDLPGSIHHRPHGVLSVIGPFNFPGHLPNGQYIPALLMGNTVIFKPSERGALTGAIIAECFHEAQLPRGVFNLVQGDGALASYLTSHRGIDGVLFTGSVAVGKAIMRANVDLPGRLLMLELGGKNASIVLEDCDMERTVREVAFSAFVTAGQRCSCTSRVYVSRAIGDAFIARFAEIAREIRIGHPAESNVFAGPVISTEALVRVLSAQDVARRSGVQYVAGGAALDHAKFRGNFLQPSVAVLPANLHHIDGYTDQELFAPDVFVVPVSDLDEAIMHTNDSEFGLSAAVFTSSEEKFAHAAAQLDVGVLHHNRSTAGASSRLPFGGIKNSGNHRPAGIMASVACSYAQARLKPQAPSAMPSWPGFPAP